MMDSILSLFVPIRQEGYPFIIVGAILSILCFFFFKFLGLFIFALTIFCAYFFRDPPRVVPQQDSLIVSPADGRIVLIQEVTPPEEVGIGDEPRVRISIFLNIFDCHIQRAPISGVVKRIIYKKGLFLSADLDKASENNERNSVVIENKAGDSVLIVQIAGLIARRISCFLQEGHDTRAGVRLGLIRFGSRVDIYLPVGKKPLVAVGQRVVGGETIIADLESSETQRVFLLD